MGSGTGFWFLASDSALAADLSAALSLVLLPQPAATQREHEQRGDGESFGSSQTGASARHCADHGAAMATPPASRLDGGAKLRGPAADQRGQQDDVQDRPPRLRPARRSASPCTPCMPSLGPGDGPLDHAIASWVYTAVMWVGSAMCLLAAAVRRRERGAWALIGIGLLFWSGGDLVWTLWLAQPREPALSERRRRPLPRQLRRDLRRAADAAALAPAPDPPRAMARRRGRRPRRCRGRRRARLPRPGRDHRGRHDRRRLQPRLSGLRRPAAHAHRHGLRPEPLARGPLVAAARASGSWPTSWPTRSSAISRPSAPTSRARGSTRCGRSARR